MLRMSIANLCIRQIAWGWTTQTTARFDIIIIIIITINLSKETNVAYDKTNMKCTYYNIYLRQVLSYENI
jgi:hypothetical protein